MEINKKWKKSTRPYPVELPLTLQQYSIQDRKMALYEVSHSLPFSYQVTIMRLYCHIVTFIWNHISHTAYIIEDFLILAVSYCTVLHLTTFIISTVYTASIMGYKALTKLSFLLLVTFVSTLHPRLPIF